MVPGSFEIIDVNTGNVDETGFFCLRSKRDSEGYRRKRAWLEARFGEGLHIKMASGGWRGFIEYMPGARAWRAVHAEDFMLIHCLWVTGQSKGQGLGPALLDLCLEDARSIGLSGVAVVVSTNSWLAGPKFYLRHGFREVARAPHSFSLMARRFRGTGDPSFPEDWDERAARCGQGLTVLRTDQCPYLAETVDVTRALARERGMGFTEIVLRTAEEVRRRSPSAYGVFGIVLDGRFLDYRPLGRKELKKRLPGS
jgi:ribosomal protein S18 acetylase RimI-like enzyme